MAFNLNIDELIYKHGRSTTDFEEINAISQRYMDRTNISIILMSVHILAGYMCLKQLQTLYRGMNEV